jgi:hypothetical protein
MSVHLDVYFRALVKTFLYDHEINVRRAAAAAFQENVGRQVCCPIDVKDEQF